MPKALPTILTNIANIDTLIASLPSDSSPTTPLASGDDTQTAGSLKHIRDECEIFVKNGWIFFACLTFNIAEPHKSYFQTIVLDDPSFPDLILNSFKLNHKVIREAILRAIENIVAMFPSMREQFMNANLVVRITHYQLAASLALMLTPIRPFQKVSIICARISDSLLLRNLELNFDHHWNNTLSFRTKQDSRVGQG
ncbi:hypothetical protein BLNAU_3895 [Blattamonas nauphoetae]|uniref:Uncharacterized protein n=1 Tax=Blattamonas nauphoetae TaxID=2049346 RepID=A0ABQ9YBI5_9EUKA|nr:hypothetical protein BLNAU_3895 [Blattamonas nauphoetae]